MHVPVINSERAIPPGARIAAEVDPNEIITLTIRVRPRKAIDDETVAALGATPLHERSYMSYETLVAEHGADPEDLERVARFAADAGLKVVSTDAGKRTVVVRGPVSKVRPALGNISLKVYAHGNTTYRGRVGPVHLPESVAEVVEGLFGLDNRRQAKPHATLVRTPAVIQTYLPRDVGRLYSFPFDATGRGQCIGILEFGGGFSYADLNAYWMQCGVRPPRVTPVVIDGGGSTPPDDANTEVALDIEVAGAIAPGASIAVYFAPFTEQGWVDALLAAVHDRVNKPSVISISWGWTEGFEIWTRQAINAVNDALKQAALLGITVCAASGDDGSAGDQDDGRVHVQFPSASPFVLACGGTTLLSAGATILSETVWNRGPRSNPGGGASGGGVSVTNPPPSWQAGANVPASLATGQRGRGVPDVSGNADGATGYNIIVNQQWDTVGGTSAVAPLWAGLAALLNEKLGRNIGFVNPILYDNGAPFRDIVVGSNDTTGQYGGYKARRGWDACTGLGSPNGTALCRALSGDAIPATVFSWQQVPGSAIDIAVVGQGTLFIIGTDSVVYRWNGSSWLPQGAAGVRIAADANGTAWIVGLDRMIYRQSGFTWCVAGGPAADIAAGCDGSIWAAGINGSLLRFGGASWKAVARNVCRVSAWDETNVWVVQTNGTVAQWNDQKLTPAHATAFDVAATSSGVWAATRKGLASRDANGTWQTATPPMDAAAVSADAEGLPWIAAQDTRIWVA